MGIRHYSNGCVFVDLSPEPEMAGEIKELTQSVQSDGDCDVIVGLSNAQLIGSESLVALVKLQKVLNDCGRNLVLFGVGPLARGILDVTGLSNIFAQAENESQSLALIGVFRHLTPLRSAPATPARDKSIEQI